MLGRRVPMILQSEAPECGIACVAMIASYHGFRTDLSAMRLRLAPSMKGVTLKHISAIADTMKLAARGVKVPLEGLGAAQAPGHPALGHEPLRRADEGLRRQDHRQRPGAWPPRADADGSVRPLHRRGDGAHAHRRLRRARRAREDQCVAAGEDGHRPAQRRHAGAAAVAGAGSAGDRLAIFPAARGRSRRRRPRPRPAGGARHRLRAAGGDDRRSSRRCARGSASTSARGSTCSCSTRCSPGCCGCRWRGSRSATSATSSRASARSTRSSARCR